MIWLYRLIFPPALVIALPFYLLRMWKRGGYKKDFQHRFGLFGKLPPAAEGKTRVWIQAVSVGEVLSVGTLIKELQLRGAFEIVLTTTTSTGYAEARKRYGDTVFSSGVFPLDFWIFSRIAWSRIQPDAIFLTDSELWPEHLHQAKKRKTPAFLINARISDRSMRRYLMVPELAKRMISKFTAIYPTSSTDGSRIQRLGAAEDRIHPLGSLKFDTGLPEEVSPERRLEMVRSLGFSTKINQNPFVILGSSTWPGEESALVEIFGEIAASHPHCVLLLVPRHAERGDEVAAELSKQELPWRQKTQAGADQRPVRILLADATGELSRLTQIADLVFIGKSLNPNQGGQSPIEAAAWGAPLLFGPNMSNFRDIAGALLEAGAAKQVDNPTELRAALLALVDSKTDREVMSKAGRTWHASHRGSSKRVAESIVGYLSRSAKD